MRSSGVLLHLTSLPGPHGCGDLGGEARAFVDFLARTGQRWWQMLPVGPVGHGDSPYSAPSAFAGNPLLIDLDALGIPLDRDVKLPTAAVDYEATKRFREAQLSVAFTRRDPKDVRYTRFCEREEAWLDDFAEYMAEEKDADPEYVRWQQWVFDEQWSALKEYANDRGVRLIGDIPIFVAKDSADVWANEELFDFDHVAGVPPDYFSKTGQRWGNPLYRWSRMKKDGYAWWVARFRMAARRFDLVRLDHFIGFARYWQVPADEDTAVNGRWMKGPGVDLFDRVRDALGKLPFIAEDLGAVSPRVTRLRRELGLPGMRLLQFAFGSDPQVETFKPHAHTRSSFVYTGTHDNNTVRGWFFEEAAKDERRRALAYLGRESEDPADVDISWEMIRLAMMSVAKTAIVPMQDILGLGSEGRMNFPGKSGGNWRWRMAQDAVTPAIEERLNSMTRTYDRKNPR